MLSEKNLPAHHLIIYIIVGGIILLAVLIKLSFNISINQLKYLIPEAELKI
jgi:hypothetical protein